MIGIPRGIFYYYYGYIWEHFFDYLDIKYMVSPPTNKEIINNGALIANDEMCQSMKCYLGHVSYLSDNCDYILIPRIDNYGIDDQMCTNFMSLYDIVNNLFDNKILNYNVDYVHHQTDDIGLIKLGIRLGKSKRECIMAYNNAIDSYKDYRQKLILKNIHKLRSRKKKVLIIGHAYNVCDNYMGLPIIKLFESNGVEVIYGYLFDSKETNKRSKKYSKNLYWKYSKELIGSIDFARVDGIVFFSTFPCGLDSLVNELIMRKISIPYINLVVDEISNLSGFETRIESFVDLINNGGRI